MLANKMTEKNFFPIYVLFLGGLVIQISIPLGIEKLVSLGTWIIFFSVFLAFGTALIQNKLNGRILLSIALLVIFSFISMLYNNSLNYKSFVSMVCFLEIPLLMSSYRFVSGKITNFIGVVMFVLSIYYICLSKTDIAYRYATYYGVSYVDFMTLGYNNPNETAIYLTACIIALATLISKIRSKYIKYLLCADIIYLLYLLWCTKSRTAILTVIIFFVLCLIYRKIKISTIIFISFLIPFLFLIVTLQFDSKMFNLNVLGESFETGRNVLYSDVITDLDFFKVLFGDFTYHFQNLHNGFFSVFATIGILGFCVFLCVFYINIKRNAIMNYKNQTAAIGILCLIISTSTEAALITAGSAFTMMFMANYFNMISTSKDDFCNENITS